MNIHQVTLGKNQQKIVWDGVIWKASDRQMHYAAVKTPVLTAVFLSASWVPDPILVVVGSLEKVGASDFLDLLQLKLP